MFVGHATNHYSSRYTQDWTEYYHCQVNDCHTNMLVMHIHAYIPVCDIMHQNISEQNAQNSRIHMIPYHIFFY